jgi:hypothetical protein
VVKKNQTISVEVYRVEGADVYGSFLIGFQLLDQNNQILKEWKGNDLAQFPKENIHNHYVAKIKPGKHSLVIPLGAKADIELNYDKTAFVKSIKFIDISGLEWQIPTD